MIPNRLPPMLMPAYRGRWIRGSDLLTSSSSISTSSSSISTSSSMSFGGIEHPVGSTITRVGPVGKSVSYSGPASGTITRVGPARKTAVVPPSQ